MEKAKLKVKELGYLRPDFVFIDDLTKEPSMKQRITHEEYQTLPNDQKLRYNQIRPIGCDMHPYYELRANFSSSSVDEIIWKTRNVQSLENHLKAMGLTPLISPEEKVLSSVREFETHSSFIEGLDRKSVV